jgi:hypothetical protein
MELWVQVAVAMILMIAAFFIYVIIKNLSMPKCEDCRWFVKGERRREDKCMRLKLYTNDARYLIMPRSCRVEGKFWESK